ncbi:ankyrin repeat protein [Colletotrichum musicola]|uniref:Ankyrin repeat protein n=1 Tax=Colletotrichum musicola TaxID=2175873 RepID=A0A8H6MKI7_9PEZI|nr:ankyrin repeat protein [Colletotrichum musicola]
MHFLGEDWYSDSKSALLDLTQQLRSNRFPVQAQDVYGQTLAHLACRNIQDPVTLGKLRLFDSNTLSKRNAFGLKPESLTLLRNEVDRNPLIYKKPVARDPGGPGGIEALWRLDDPVPQENASPVEIAAYEVRVLRFINETIKKPRKEDSQGRNGLHCLAIAISARLRYLFSGILEISSFTRRHVWTAGTLNDQAATTSRAQLVRNALSQAAKYLSLLIKAGVDFGSYNTFGNTILMDFVAFLPEEAGNLQSKEILRALIDTGVRLEARNRKGETALLVAARLCRRTALKVLIDAGARIEARDADGRDAVTIIKDCVPTTNQDSVSTINYKGCLKEPSGASVANEETHCGRKLRPISTDSLSADLNSLADDMCDLVLSRAFGVSMDDVARPQDVWASIRRCLGELSTATSESSQWASQTHHWTRHEEIEGGGSSHVGIAAMAPATALGPYGRGSTGYHVTAGVSAVLPVMGANVTSGVISRHSISRGLTGRINILPAAVATRNLEHSGTGMPIFEFLQIRSAVFREVVDNTVIDDPEDGITAEVAERLRDRRAKVSVTNWAALWYALFPEDEEVKSDEFDPIIEADEVKKAFERNTGRCASALQRVFSLAIKHFYQA